MKFRSLARHSFPVEVGRFVPTLLKSVANFDKMEFGKFMQDFICGSAAGFTTGLVVGSPEYIKVKVQVTPREQLRATLLDTKTWQKAATNTPFFSVMFSAVCAIEFSVNKRVQEHFGPYAGVFASAVSGGLFLVAADHTMYARDRLKLTVGGALKANSGARLLTGFSPMFMREAFFITSVMHAGPLLGRTMQQTRLLGDTRSDDAYMMAGRLTAGIPMSLLSQPFDCLAREMQKHLASTGETPRLLPLAARMYHERTYFRGFVPRSILATVGGTMAGYVFDRTTRLF